MLPNFYIDKSKLNYYLTELGKEYRKLSKNPIQIVVVGGVAILTKYNFRAMSLDLDGIFVPNSDALKQAISNVSDKLSIPKHWLNDDFKYTKSYSDKISLYSDYYRTFSNLIEVRLVKATYLIAMKIVASRSYRNDLSDALGILIEEKKNGNIIKKQEILKSLKDLYGDKYESLLSKNSKALLDSIFDTKTNWEELFREIKLKETSAENVVKQNRNNKNELEIKELLQRIESYFGILPIEAAKDDDINRE